MVTQQRLASFLALLASALMMLGVARANQIFTESVSLGHKLGEMHVFIKMPRNWTEGRVVKGVAAFCSWKTKPEEVKADLEQGAFYISAFAAENDFAVITWTTPKVHDARKNFDEIERETQRVYEKKFNSIANAWDKVMRRWIAEYDLPKQGYFMYGISGGGQFVHRLALRLPHYFSAVHAHISSSYDKPNKQGAQVAWLITTGEYEYGYDSTITFYKEAMALGYNIVVKAAENTGHGNTGRIDLLGRRYFEFIQDNLPNELRSDDSLGPTIRSKFRHPDYVGDYFNQIAYPKEQAKHVRRVQAIALPTKTIATAWGEIFDDI